jgi:hypothetical protein
LTLNSQSKYWKANSFKSLGIQDSQNRLWSSMSGGFGTLVVTNAQS